MGNNEERNLNQRRTSSGNVPAWKTQENGQRSIHNASRRPSGYVERYTVDDLDTDDELEFDSEGSVEIKKNRNFRYDKEERVQKASVPAWKRSEAEEKQYAETIAASRRARSVDSDLKEKHRVSTETSRSASMKERRPAGTAVRRPADSGERRSADTRERRPVDTREKRPADNAEKRPADSRERRPAAAEEKRSAASNVRRGSGQRSLKRRMRKAARRTPLLRYAVAAVLALLILAGGVFAIKGVIRLIGGGSNVVAGAMPSQKELSKKVMIATADKKAAMYDYDAAIDILKEYPGYETDEEIGAAIEGYETTKASLVEYPVDEVTHVFFHMLLYEPDRAFNESDNPTGMNQYMTTVDEFKKIIQSMYDKGYVLVSLYDVAAPGADGNFEAGHIMLPPGKKAFVLSEDDVCCYHAYENAGIADKFVIDDATGKVKTHYTYADGTEEVGDFDVMPILDSFVEEHPDFSYKGAKGILAFTGYNGILGYRTDTTYDDDSPDVVDRDRHETAWLDAHPDFNYDEEVEECKRVTAAIRENGWLLASHSWGHLWQEKMGDDDFDEDTQKWMERVYPLLGECDIWIYPNGQDVDNDYYQHRFETLQSYGFKYFCPVNSLQYSTRIDSYGLNQGRRNLDGYRMYYDMIDDDVDMLSDLFDVDEVFDSARPTPVPEI